MMPKKANMINIDTNMFFFYNKNLHKKINKQETHTAVPQTNIFFCRGESKN